MNRYMQFLQQNVYNLKVNEILLSNTLTVQIFCLTYPTIGYMYEEYHMHEAYYFKYFCRFSDSLQLM